MKYYKKKLKDFIIVLYKEYSKIGVYRINFKKAEVRKKRKIDDEKFKMIMEMLKEVNILSALDIEKKLIGSGVSVSSNN